MKKNPIILAIMALFLTLTSCTRENVRGVRVIHNAVTDIDGNHYDAVQIGNQVWMQSNLRTTRFRDGSAIPRGSFYDYDNYTYTEPYYYQLTTQQFPTYDEKTYGMYYNWAAVDDTRGLCPKGWHVPTDAEWTELEEYVESKSEFVYGGNPENIAKALASNVGWYEDDEPGTPGCEPEKNNATGFTAVPAGNYLYGYGNYYYYFSCGYSAVFWSSTEDSFWSSPEGYSYDAYGRSISDSEAYVSRVNYSKKHAFSVRCVRDNKNVNN